MPAKGFLNLEQQKKLQKTLKEHEHPEIRARILIFLLLNDGKTQLEIASFLGCSLRKVDIDPILFVRSYKFEIPYVNKTKKIKF